MDGVSLRIAGIQHKSGIGAWTLPQARTVRISKDTTRERKVRGKPEGPYDFVAIIVISFALSVGFHHYQRHLYNDLLLENTALEWDMQDVESNQLLNQRKPAARNS
jgi:hypothetical protein